MKIRKKTPKWAQAKPPLYLIGYRDMPPSMRRLTQWYDLQYGGPLGTTEREPGSSINVTHGPWRAHLLLTIPDADAAPWHQQLAWDHRVLAAVSPSGALPGTVADTVLLTARLARGLTLLTEGTAFDISTQTYLNPSDWNDCGLDQFHLRDHVTVQHQETADGMSEWFYTAGLNKFGLDELELFQPRGLPETETIALLTAAAEQVLRLGHNQRIGSRLDLPAQARTVHITKHRTASPTGRVTALREISLDPGA